MDCFYMLYPSFCCVGGLMVILSWKDYVVLRKAHKVSLMEVQLSFNIQTIIIFKFSKSFLKKLFNVFWPPKKLPKLELQIHLIKVLSRYFQCCVKLFNWKSFASSNQFLSGHDFFLKLCHNFSNGHLIIS
jgi:hypothetical protein